MRLKTLRGDTLIEVMLSISVFAGLTVPLSEISSSKSTGTNEETFISSAISPQIAFTVLPSFENVYSNLFVNALPL